MAALWHLTLPLHRMVGRLHRVWSGLWFSVRIDGLTLVSRFPRCDKRSSFWRQAHEAALAEVTRWDIAGRRVRNGHEPGGNERSHSEYCVGCDEHWLPTKMIQGE